MKNLLSKFTPKRERKSSEQVGVQTQVKPYYNLRDEYEITEQSGLVFIKEKDILFAFDTSHINIEKLNEDEYKNIDNRIKTAIKNFPFELTDTIKKTFGETLISFREYYGPEIFTNIIVQGKNVTFTLNSKRDNINRVRYLVNNSDDYRTFKEIDFTNGNKSYTERIEIAFSEQP